MSSASSTTAPLLYYHNIPVKDSGVIPFRRVLYGVEAGGDGSLCPFATNVPSAPGSGTVVEVLWDPKDEILHWARARRHRKPEGRRPWASLRRFLPLRLNHGYEYAVLYIPVGCTVPGKSAFQHWTEWTISRVFTACPVAVHVPGSPVRFTVTGSPVPPPLGGLTPRTPPNPREGHHTPVVGNPAAGSGSRLMRHKD